MKKPEQLEAIRKRIVEMKIKGYTNGQIRDELDIGETTIAKHWKTYTDKNPSVKKNRVGNRGVK